MGNNLLLTMTNKNFFMNIEHLVLKNHNNTGAKLTSHCGSEVMSSSLDQKVASSNFLESVILRKTCDLRLWMFVNLSFHAHLGSFQNIP